MRTTMKAQRTVLCRGLISAPPRPVMKLTCRAQLPHQQRQQQSKAVDQTSLALAAALLPLSAAFPALAEEAETAASTAGPSIAGLTPLGLVLAFSPVFIYGAFWVYREKVNPRAKLIDLVFIVAATVIIGNIFSILVFKKRIY